MTSSALRHPAPGHVVELNESADWRPLAALVDFDFDDRLDDDALLFTGQAMAGVIIGGDVHVTGSVSSSELPFGRPGFTPRETKESKRYFVVVLGDLIVDGDLKVVQYNDLLVTGRLRAKTIRGASANLIVKGRVEAEELICYEDSEEGGILYGASFHTPLLVRLGCENDVEQTVDGRLVADSDRADRSALRMAVYDLKSIDASSSLDLYRAIASLIEAGKGKTFVEALEAPSDDEPSSDDEPPSED